MDNKHDIVQTGKGVRSFHDTAKKRVSFIINTKNRARFLEQALEQARQLLEPNDELIVIDGASRDETRNVVSRYRDIIDIFVSEPDNNSAEALNKGILLASGIYIRHLPDDDITHKEGLDAAIAALENNPEIDILVCGGHKQKGERVHTVYLDPGTNYGSNIQDPFQYGACGAGFFIRRDAFARAGLYSNSISADVEFILRCISRGVSVKFCRTMLYTHILYPHSVASRDKNNTTAEGRRLAKHYLPRKKFYSYVARIALHTGKRKIRAMIGARKKIDANVALEKTKRKPPRQYTWDGGFS